MTVQFYMFMEMKWWQYERGYSLNQHSKLLYQCYFFSWICEISGENVQAVTAVSYSIGGDLVIMLYLCCLIILGLMIT